jgi:hypothetical protein
MARRTRSILGLRREAELAEKLGLLPTQKSSQESQSSGGRRSSGKRAPVRVCASWGVFDSAMKLVVNFPYNQKAQAEQKVAELNAARTGTYFLQIVKETIAEQNDFD